MDYGAYERRAQKINLNDISESDNVLHNKLFEDKIKSDFTLFCI